MIGEWVIVRTHSAGVHFGRLKSLVGTVCELEESRNIWSWTGANTLREVSLHGVGEKSKISESVERHLLTQVTEVIPVTEKAKENLMRSRWS